MCRKVKSAPVQDDVAGTWTDGYSDNTGTSSRSNVDVNSGVLQLTNGSGGFTPPYNTSGYAITTNINPPPI